MADKTTGSANGQGNDQAGFIDRIKNSGGILLAGFIGVANFVGISSGEVPNILRNDDAAADLTAILVVLALLAAVVSSLLPQKKPIWAWWLLPLGIAVIAMAFLPRVLINVATDNGFRQWLIIALLIGIAIAAGAAFLVVAVARLIVMLMESASAVMRHPNAGALAEGSQKQLTPTDGAEKGAEGSSTEHATSNGGTAPPAAASAGTGAKDAPGSASWPDRLTDALRARLDYKAPLLVLAIVLTVIASYSALRTEAASQGLAARPQVTSTLTFADKMYTLTVKVDDSRLGADSKVRLTVYAWTTQKSSLSNPVPAPYECDQETCNCVSAGCIAIGDGYYGPDQNGNVTASYNLTFPAGYYTNLRILGSRSALRGAPCQPKKVDYCYSSVNLIIPGS